MSKTEPKKTADLQTPCFLVDLARVQNNCQAMKERCLRLGVKLRPMMKTHKCLEAGVIATNGTKRCISASTVAEAEFFADGGFDDILLTLIFTEDKIQRMKSLCEKLSQFTVMVDSLYGVQLLEANSVSGKKWSVLIMVDTGDKRSGVLWDSSDVVELAQKVHNSNRLHLAGIYAHDGNSYESSSVKEVKTIGQEGTLRLVKVKERLSTIGVKVETVGIGSTPTSSNPSDNMKELTQLHPGNYIFYDVQQMSLGSCSVKDIAGRVMTRITGHYPHRNQMLVDAGFLATSHDGRDCIPGGGTYCMVENEPNLKLVKACQEVGFIEAVDSSKLDYSKYPIGSIIYLLPWHSCATAAMYSKYYVHQGDEVVAVWYNNHNW